MSQIYKFISSNMIAVIIIAGLLVTGFLFWNYVELRTQNNYINSLMDWKNTRTFVNKNTGEVEDIKNEEKVTPDTIRELELKFNKVRSIHEVLAQLIPIFPLLGILGTVAGLIEQLSTGDIDMVIGSLNLAMNSTFWGLVFAILLKAMDAIFPARTISDMEIIFDNYEKKLNNALKLGNIAD
ncbi:MAG: MotA/TolQ/ExbB proton channel family protein [Lachnospiraceae bacterium]|nr:MotA/TolQ/ExbB proton channel family protein [Lachnospiraceae bacterium]